jgi:hypothetical protein
LIALVVTREDLWKPRQRNSRMANNRLKIIVSLQPFLIIIRIGGWFFIEKVIA